MVILSAFKLIINLTLPLLQVYLEFFSYDLESRQRRFSKLVRFMGLDILE